MAVVLSPFVYWGQDKDFVYLKIDLKEVLNPEIELDEDSLSFRAQGLGVGGRKDYGFKVDFYLPVSPKMKRVTIQGRCVQVRLTKQGRGECWPRLTAAKERRPWLKIDFDHFMADNEDSDDDELGDTQRKRIEDDVGAVCNSAGTLNFRILYMFLFNMFQWVGYLFIVIKLLARFLLYDTKTEAYSAVGPQVAAVLAVAGMEGVHSLFGWVRLSAPLAFLMTAGRCVILLLVAFEPRLQRSEVVWYIFIAWSAIEIVRHTYYMLNCVRKRVAVVTWLRHSVWIPLYPLVFVLEGVLMMLALPYYEQSGRWRLSLPYNVIITVSSLLRVYMLACMPGIYFLMRKMYSERKRMIGRKLSKGKQKRS